MRNIEALVVLGQPTPTHAEVQPSLAQVIDRGHVLREVKRVGQRQDLYGDTDAYPLGPGGDGRGDDEGRGQNGAALLEVDLGQPHGVEAERLRRRHLGECLVEGLGLVHPRRALELGEEPDLHAIPGSAA